MLVYVYGCVCTRHVWFVHSGSCSTNLLADRGAAGMDLFARGMESYMTHTTHTEKLPAIAIVAAVSYTCAISIHVEHHMPLNEAVSTPLAAIAAASYQYTCGAP